MKSSGKFSVTLFFQRLAAGIAVLAAVWVQSVPAAQSNSRRLYLRILNEDGVLVSDLKADEVELREDDVTQKVTRVSLSNEPMRIALLVDTTESSQIKLPDLRAALDAFIQAIPAPHELMLVTTGQQVQVRAQPTTDRKKVAGAAASLFGVGGGTLLFDGLVDIDDRFMKKAIEKTPVFVVVSGDGTESSQRYDERFFDRLTQNLTLRNVPVHAIVLSTGTAKMPLQIALHVSQATGGHSEVIGASTMLAERMALLARTIVEADREMSEWYEIDYVSTSKTGRSEVQVGISRPNVRTQFSTRRLVK
jgi:hypothetical protein